MAFNNEQLQFIRDHRFLECEAHRELFPQGIAHADYALTRARLLADPEINQRALPRDERGRFAKIDRPRINLPESLNEAEGRDLWTAVQTFQESHRTQIANQILTDVEIKVDTSRPFGVVFMSDWHIGSLGTDHEALLRDIDVINSCDQLVAYVGGDPTDNFIGDKLAHAGRDTQLVNPAVQWKMFRYAIELLQPSLLAVGRGNHDLWSQREAGIDGVAMALRGIPVLHTAEDTYIDLTVGEQTYVIYRKHRPIGSSRNNRTAGVKRSYDLGKRLFDVGVTEHHHESAMSVEMRHGYYRWFITTGSYKIADAHAREWGFHHGGVGTPVVIFYPFRKKMVGYLSLEDAIEHLQG